MNILLTNSPAPVFSPFSTDEKRPPLGLGFLISVLKKAGHNVFFIDNYLDPSDFLKTDYLNKNKIDYIGFYINTVCLNESLDMLNQIQELREKRKWSGKIIVGGPHTSVELKTIPDFVDYIVQGEGEQAILDILLDNKTERIVKQGRCQKLDSLPFPAWDYFVNLPYDFTVEWFNQVPVFTMNTSRGCPFNCAFCSVSSIWGVKYFGFNAERIVKEIEYLIKNYQAQGIYFREDNFTVDKSRVKKICLLLLDKKINIKWACETRVDTLDKELIKLMKKAGCQGFYIGVESGSQRMLDFLEKKTNLKQIEKVFQWAREVDVKTYASFMVGLPTETSEELQQTLDFSQKIKPDSTGFNIFVGIPESKLYHYVIDNNLYEYIDKRGLVYLKGHDKLVDRFYHGDIRTKIPKREPTNKEKKIYFANLYLKQGMNYLMQKKHLTGFKRFFKAMKYNAGDMRIYPAMVLCLFPFKLAQNLKYWRQRIKIKSSQNKKLKSKNE